MTYDELLCTIGFPAVVDYSDEHNIVVLDQNTFGTTWTLTGPTAKDKYLFVESAIRDAEFMPTFGVTTTHGDRHGDDILGLAKKIPSKYSGYNSYHQANYEKKSATTKMVVVIETELVTFADSNKDISTVFVTVIEG